MEQESISLNKFISSKGLCSRRVADTWIEQGRVKINGKVAVKGNRVFPNDEVSIDDALRDFWDREVTKRSANMTTRITNL